MDDNSLSGFSRATRVFALAAAIGTTQACSGSLAPYEPDAGQPASTAPIAAGDGGLVSADATAASGAPDGSPANRCLAGITSYDKPGPFSYRRKTVGLVNMWVPNVPKGCKVPMVHLANGTGAFCGIYAPSLKRLASHGFLALCFQSPITGAGIGGMVAFQTALKEFPKLADYKFGSTGHSQGGQGALVTLQYAEAKWGAKGTYAGLAMQPASGFGAQPLTGLWTQVYAKIKSPVFMFSGLVTDGLVPQVWVKAAYLALSDTTEAYHWAKAFSLHIPVPNRAEQQISIPWFRWKLLGDKKACKHFKAIPHKDRTWSVVASQAARPCN